jgi:tetratricopeptide (TPR) repeat protein
MWTVPIVVLGAALALCVALAAPAYAQLGSLKGRVVDETGKPVPDAEVTFEFLGELTFKFVGKTNSNGEWTRAGLHAVGGRWTITAKKDDRVGFMTNVEVPLSAVSEVGDIVIRPGGKAPGPPVSQAEAEARNRQAAELKQLFDETNAAIASNSYDVAIAKLTEAAGRVKDCGVCYARMGDIYVKQQNHAKAEESYKQAIALDGKLPEAYDGLAIVYNAQKRFEEATKANQMASELRGASGGAGDANSVYNAGVILVNQGKMAEARAQFEKAVQLNPKMADAHYQLGMTFINEGKVAEAIKSLETYLQLDPNGKNAQMAKDLLPELKKMQ